MADRLTKQPRARQAVLTTLTAQMPQQERRREGGSGERAAILNMRVKPKEDATSKKRPMHRGFLGEVSIPKLDAESRIFWLGRIPVTST